MLDRASRDGKDNRNNELNLSRRTRKVCQLIGRKQKKPYLSHFRRFPKRKRHLYANHMTKIGQGNTNLCPIQHQLHSALRQRTVTHYIFCRNPLNASLDISQHFVPSFSAQPAEDRFLREKQNGSGKAGYQPLLPRRAF